MYVPFDERLGIHPQDEDFLTTTVGLRDDAAGGLPAAAALPVLRPLPQAGRQAGRPRARAVVARRAFTREEKRARLRLLRGAHRARLVAVGLHPGGRGRRGRPPRPGLRLPRRGRAHGPPRPRAQRRRRRAHGLAGRRGDGRDRRAGRHARHRRPAVFCAAPAARARAARLPHHVRRRAGARRGAPGGGRLRHRRRTWRHARALRRAVELRPGAEPVARPIPPGSGSRGRASRRGASRCAGTSASRPPAASASQNPAQRRVCEAALRVEAVADGGERRPSPGSAARAPRRPSQWRLPQCGRPPRPSSSSSTARKYGSNGCPRCWWTAM